MQTLTPRDVTIVAWNNAHGHLPSVFFNGRQEMESTSCATDFKSSALNSHMSSYEFIIVYRKTSYPQIPRYQLIFTDDRHSCVEHSPSSNNWRNIVWFHVPWVFAGILGDTVWYSTPMTTSGFVCQQRLDETWWDFCNSTQVYEWILRFSNYRWTKPVLRLVGRSWWQGTLGYDIAAKTFDEGQNSI